MRRLLTRPAIWILGSLLVLAGASPHVHAQARQPSRANGGRGALPTLCAPLQEVRFIVDPNSSSASAQIELCPPGNQSSAAATLTAGDFTSRMTKLGLGAKITFSNAGQAAGAAAFQVPVIQPGKVITVKAEVTNLWEAGEAEAPLRANGVPMGKLVAVKYRLPFDVKVDAADPARPEMILERSHDYDVVLKNADPVTYEIEWDFQVAGSTLKGKRIVTANSTVKFTIQPDSRWYRGFTGLLRDYDQEAKLTLSFRPPGVDNAPYWPSKVVPVKAHLRYASQTARAWAANLLLIAVLFAGAMASFLGSVGLPNRLKRTELRENLERLGRRITGISHAVDSRLRVVTRVQRRRLSDELESRTSISPDLNRVFQQVSAGTAALEKQVHLAEQIDSAHAYLKVLDARGNAPSLLSKAEDTLWRAADVIARVTPTDQELDQSQDYVNKALADMERADHAEVDPDFPKELVDRAKQVQEVNKTYLLTDIYKKISQALPGVFLDLGVTAPPTKPEEIARLDRNLTKLELISRFLQIYNVTSNPAVRSELEKQLERLQTEMSRESGEAVRTARRLVRQMEEGVYASDLVQAGVAGTAHIEMDPSVAVANNLIRFSVRFEDPRLNTAAARLEFDGRWNFGHDEYTEMGWEPFHYFPAQGTFNVRFSFQAAGDKAPIVIPRDIKVQERKESWYKRDRNRAELGRFVITLLPAIFGLLAGARQELLKMDVASAIFAVFLLGFSSDTVKNLVTQSGQTSPSPPASPESGQAAKAGSGGGPTTAAGNPTP